MPYWLRIWRKLAMCTARNGSSYAGDVFTIPLTISAYMAAIIQACTHAASFLNPVPRKGATHWSTMTVGACCIEKHTPASYAVGNVAVPGITVPII
jgi:hypothetical protein